MAKETIGHLQKKYSYDTQYKKEHLDQVLFCVPKGYKDKIKEQAAKEGLSMSELLKKITYEYMEKATE